MKKKSFLNSIDDFFASKKESEAKLYFFLVGLIIAVLAYLIVSPMSQTYFDNEDARLNKVTDELLMTDSYLKSVSGPAGNDLNYEIRNKQRILNDEKNRLTNYVDANKYIDDKLIEVSSVTYNEKNWAKFLDSLTTLAQKNNVKLSYLFSNTKDLENAKVQEVLSVNLNAEATFHDMLRYINEIEESEMVVDINGIDINATEDNTIAGDINISLWGMKYGGVADINVDEANANLSNEVNKKMKPAGGK